MLYCQQQKMEHKPLDQNHPPPRRGKPPEAGQNLHNHQPPPPQKCPRCDSSNTKFCYYNNYSLSQPRYFCKGCRRYWTQGGTLRNVPVGGGCRKSKRPKPSISSSSTGEIGRSQSLSSPALPSQNMISGGMRALPAVMPSMGNSFYSGGSFLSTLAAMQSINQGGTSNLGGGGNGQYDANLALLQGVNLQSLRPQAAAEAPPPPQQHFQAQNYEFFPSQQTLTIPARPMGSWTQSFMNRSIATSSSATNPSFWGGATADSDNQGAGSSFNPSHWPDNHHPGFDPPQ